MSTGSVSLLKKNVARRIDDTGVTAVCQAVAVGADAINADDVTQVFNGAGLQQGLPVHRALFRPVEWRAKCAGFECDVYIPDIALAIEIDGAYWHRNKIELDKTKNEALKAAGLKTQRYQMIAILISY